MDVTLNDDATIEILKYVEIKDVSTIVSVNKRVKNLLAYYGIDVLAIHH